jgi:hypothetical protein
MVLEDLLSAGFWTEVNFFKIFGDEVGAVLVFIIFSIDNSAGSGFKAYSFL